MKYTYDLFVIGGGSGGVRAANVAARHGARVGLAEERDLGGTCVNRGCVPKKLLVATSRFAAECEHARHSGWRVEKPTIDWPQLTAKVEHERLRLSAIYRRNLVESGVTIHPSRAGLLDANTIVLASGEQITAGKILIATGGMPRLAGAFPGSEHAVSSDEMFHLPSLPPRLVVIGGGYIAVEFASLMAGFGSQVTLLARDGEILPSFDTEVVAHLREALQAKGIDVRLNSKVERIESAGEQRTVVLASGERFAADVVLAAIGRVPNTQSLGLETLGVTLGKKGQVMVDAHSRSSVPTIFAVGDVTDRAALTPVAIREGHAFADSEFGDQPRKFGHALIPTAIFTTPELITVGLSEDAANKSNRAIRIFRENFRPLRQALTGDQTRVLIKLVVDAADDRVIGAHAVGPEVSEWVQFLDILIRAGATKADFDASISVHPTISEEFVTLRKAS
jgi:glutathione reductase (NADPH)